ncbi:mitochondrial splicing system protein [Malassezia cuniculi]|uniref:Mitochondrial splicing system protein n=1 Tax=Malassezia cuniculi TaxID=948313 RepID=A0AAF0EUL3_9BASI|nr:mitochondrial splicing system protein [Malassezia cuniculi]
MKGDIRPAKPGEFTRRAYDAGKMDLNSCEALDALLRAETTAQRRLALSAVNGSQTRAYERIRAQLLTCMAHVEALIDFSEEDSVDDRVWPIIVSEIDALRTLLRSEVTGRTYADLVTDGIRVVLYGRPNAGKSSLLNRLARRDAAIVSARPGTTRDVIQVSLEIGGHRVLLSDTAGLRLDETDDEIERIGMERTKSELAAADIPILVCTPQDVAESENELQGGYLYINKMDTYSGTLAAPSQATVWKGNTVADGGLDELMSGLEKAIKERVAQQDLSPLVTQTRHRHLLVQVLECLDNFAACTQSDVDLVVAAEELRHAADLVGDITGVSLTSDQVLGEIFGRFCIGK